MISQAAIANNTITIFSKTYCPYCRRAKSLFASEFPDVKTEILEYVANVYLLCNSSHIPHRLDDRDDGSEIQDYLQEKTGQRSVPNIFISTCKPIHTNLTRRSCPYRPEARWWLRHRCLPQLPGQARWAGQRVSLLSCLHRRHLFCSA